MLHSIPMLCTFFWNITFLYIIWQINFLSYDKQQHSKPNFQKSNWSQNIHCHAIKTLILWSWERGRKQKRNQNIHPIRITAEDIKNKHKKNLKKKKSNQNSFLNTPPLHKTTLFFKCILNWHKTSHFFVNASEQTKIYIYSSSNQQGNKKRRIKCSS